MTHVGDSGGSDARSRSPKSSAPPACSAVAAAGTASGISIGDTVGCGGPSSPAVSAWV